MALAPVAGYCCFAPMGREAVEAVRLALEQGKPYDLVCLDILMAGVDGHEALQAIRLLEASAAFMAPTAERSS